MLKQRILSAIIVLPPVIAAFWYGGFWFTILIAIFALLGSLEFYKISLPDKGRIFAYFGVVWTVLFILSRHEMDPRLIPVLITFAIVFPLIWLVFSFSKGASFSQWLWMLAGIFYIGWMLGYWVELRNLNDGRYWAFLALLATFANDTTAFFVGRTWGKHRLAPAISPAKTWEGAGGGILGTVVICLVFKAVVPLPAINYGQAVLLGFVISIFAQLGDLVESLIKRNTGVKDSGSLMPGHGGILDRIDSVIFTGVAVYYSVLWWLT